MTIAVGHGAAGDGPPVVLKPVGFWRQEEKEDASGLPYPRAMIDTSWPLHERVRVAKYLRAGEVACAYMGYSFCRLACGIPMPFMGTRDLTDGTWVWPEGFAHYVEHHAVKPPAEFLNDIAPRLPMMLPTWRVGHAYRKAILARRIGAQRRADAEEALLPPHTTALHDAAQAGNVAAAVRALDTISVDERNRQGATALYIAARAGRVDVVELLLGRGAAVDAKDDSHVTPLSSARSLAVTRMLVEAGATIEPAPVAHSAPLANACIQGDVDCVTFLLDRGASPNAGDKFRTPLEASSDRGIIELLLQRGADAKIGHPLAAIARYGDVESVRMLLAAGADPNAVDTRDQTPLFKAAESAKGDYVVEALLAAGADPSRANDLDDTPLHMACARTSIVTVERLLAAGASAKTKSTRGMTPLHWTALAPERRDDAAAVIELLLAAGAKGLDAKDEWGRTPLMIAESKHDETAATVLRSAVARGA